MYMAYTGKCRRVAASAIDACRAKEARTAADVHAHSIVNNPTLWQLPHAGADIASHSCDSTIEQTPSPAVSKSTVSAFGMP